LPDADGLVAMVKEYSDKRWKYRSAEDYPWPNNAAYWLVTWLYDGMRNGNWSTSELRREARRELSLMCKRIDAGESIPAPVARIAMTRTVKPLSKDESLKRLADIKEKFNLRSKNEF
jgi:hypothetical protein